MSAMQAHSPVEAFAQTLRAMSTEDIRWHAIRLEAVADDLGWWRSSIEVEHRLRRSRLSRRAAAAASIARNAVRAAAGCDAGQGLDDDMVATVSRAAAEAARALVAGCNVLGSASFGSEWGDVVRGS